MAPMSAPNPQLMYFLVAVFLGLALVAAFFAFAAPAGGTIAYYGQIAFYVLSVLFVLSLLGAVASQRRARRQKG